MGEERVVPLTSRSSGRIKVPKDLESFVVDEIVVAVVVGDFEDYLKATTVDTPW